MTRRCVLPDRHFLCHFEGMPLSDNAQVAVSKQCLDAYFRSHFLQHTNLKIGGTVSQILRILLRFGREVQTHKRRKCSHFSNQWCTEGFHESFIGTNLKRSPQR
ncbi:hypothetical protein R69919_03011 [Paraburkholderia gardini]|uniref:Uncharacterized protein n=1 Tax=Paraburkholderia gardini TaxID=2823469 RepID=A0ABM8U705_9BURK|nr:hypothetical protein R69919_03011 [Paraburkholderia gardini]CAG4910112.1 hypothetical protein R54767_03660 [Paraburkholderia gardini]